MFQLSGTREQSRLLALLDQVPSGCFQTRGECALPSKATSSLDLGWCSARPGLRCYPEQCQAPKGEFWGFFPSRSPHFLLVLSSDLWLPGRKRAHGSRTGKGPCQVSSIRRHSWPLLAPASSPSVRSPPGPLRVEGTRASAVCTVRGSPHTLSTSRVTLLFT